MTESLLGTYIRSERARRQLTRSQLAERCGYRNISKGSRRIHELETTGHAHVALLDQVIPLLQLERARVAKLEEQDQRTRKRQHEQWLDAPTRWACFMPIYKWIVRDIPIPEYIATRQDLIDFALGLAKREQRDVFIEISRREGWRVQPDGRAREYPPSLPRPGLYLKGRRLGFE